MLQGHFMTSWHLNIWKVKIWLSSEREELSKQNKKTLSLVSKVLSFRHPKQTSKNVVDTTFNVDDSSTNLFMFNLILSLNITAVKKILRESPRGLWHCKWTCEPPPWNFGRLENLEVIQFLGAKIFWHFRRGKQFNFLPSCIYIS